MTFQMSTLTTIIEIKLAEKDEVIHYGKYVINRQCHNQLKDILKIDLSTMLNSQQIELHY